MSNKQKSREYKNVSFKPTCNRYKCNDKIDLASLGEPKQRVKPNSAKRYVTIIEPPPLFKISPPPNPLEFLRHDGLYKEGDNSDQSNNYKRFLIHMLNMNQGKGLGFSDSDSDMSNDAKIYDVCNSFRLNFLPTVSGDQELKYSIDSSKPKDQKKTNAKEKYYTVDISAKKSSDKFTSTKFNFNQSAPASPSQPPRSVLTNQSGLNDSSSLFNLFIFSTISFVTFVVLLVFIYVVLTRKNGRKTRGDSHSSPNSTFSSSLNTKYAYERNRLNKDLTSNNNSLIDHEQHLLLLNHGNQGQPYKYSNYDSKFNYQKTMNQPMFVPVSLNGHQVYNHGEIQLGLLASSANNQNQGSNTVHADESSLPYESVSILNHLNHLANNATAINMANQATLSRQQQTPAVFGLLKPSDEYFTNTCSRNNSKLTASEMNTPRNDMLNLHCNQLAASMVAGAPNGLTRAILLGDNFNLCTLHNRPSILQTKPDQPLSGSFREKSSSKKSKHHKHKDGKRTKTLDCNGKYSDNENKSFLKPLIDDTNGTSPAESSPRANISLSNESSSSSSFSSYQPSTATSNVTQNNSNNSSVQAIQANSNFDSSYVETANHYQKLFIKPNLNSPMSNYVQMNAAANTINQCTIGNSSNKVALLCSTDPGSHHIIKVMTLLNNNQIKDIGLFTLPKPCYDGGRVGLMGNERQYGHEVTMNPVVPSLHPQNTQQNKFDENEEFYELIDDLCISSQNEANKLSTKNNPTSGSTTSSSAASEASCAGLVSLKKQKKYPKTNPNYSKPFLNHQQMQSFASNSNTQSK